MPLSGALDHGFAPVARTWKFLLELEVSLWALPKGLEATGTVTLLPERAAIRGGGYGL